MAEIVADRESSPRILSPPRNIATIVHGGRPIDRSQNIAFEILAREHSSMLLAFIRAMVTDRSAVDDVYQETMITAWRTLDRFDRDRPFGPWLRGIARNHALNHFRRHRKLPLPMEDEILQHLDRRIEDISNRPGDTWEEKIEALEDCLAHLPDPSRTMLDLHYRDAMNTDAIAQRLDATREAIKKRLQRTRAQLLDCLRFKGIVLESPGETS